MNNTLKTINTFATIISLKEQSKFVNNFKESNKINTVKEINNTNTIKKINTVKEINNINTIKKMDKTNTLREQLNTGNTYREQPNTDNNLREQSDIDNTLREQLNNGSNYIKLSKWLKDLKCIINPINSNKGNNKCLQYYIGLFKHKEMGANYNRINKTEPFLRNFNFENINYPLQKEDYEVFERNNESISLNILKPDKERKKCTIILNLRIQEEKLKYFYYF